MSSLEKNKTWSLIELLIGKRVSLNKWVYRIKKEHDGNKRYKGFQQKRGIDYNEALWW